MDKLFETAIFTRKTLLKVMEEKGYENLVKIPENHRNSIFWNIAHLLVTQHLLCYGLSGLELQIDQAMVNKYGKGTVAVEEVPEEDIAFVKAHLVKMVLKTQSDYKAGVFTGYRNYMTSTNIELCNIEEALAFSAYHDGIHLGVILSIMKLV
jgi:hypothetical protein